jgi:hypothetical protein
VRLAKSDDDASYRRDCVSRAQTGGVRDPSLKRKGDPEGESGSPSGLLVSRFEVGARGGLRGQDRLTPQLGNGMALDLPDTLCGNSPDRTDIGELCLTAIDESVPATYHIGGTLVE